MAWTASRDSSLPIADSPAGAAHLDELSSVDTDQTCWALGKTDDTGGRSAAAGFLFSRRCCLPGQPSGKAKLEAYI
ncbi:hypothetical protein CPLU01_00838 [Colletotrichum plurivorum]|uniref:Uncharacterized protein n=1 Tax=Colletotrichum plurivorum TaxID=2175906 RepID=A0A8H6NQV7_9PEZI|nr:hypothetical protein CPLU01_00838 [Colletotrichum plurivorum]